MTSHLSNQCLVFLGQILCPSEILSYVGGGYNRFPLTDPDFFMFNIAKELVILLSILEFLFSLVQSFLQFVIFSIKEALFNIMEGISKCSSSQKTSAWMEQTSTRFLVCNNISVQHSVLFLNILHCRHVLSQIIICN